MKQASLFDGSKPYKITKPVRLIELFAGYGSQAMALKRLGVEFEHYKLVEWAVKSIQAYKDIHCPNDNTDYSADMTKEQLVERLAEYGVSANYNESMEISSLNRKSLQWLKTAFNNIIATNNLVNICNTHWEDLEILHTEKYDYIMTYSFPCQDLSKAGKQKGMGRDSGTRSGMLWEVERILEELNENAELPQILLMENVPDVAGTKNSKNFAEWQQKLRSLGYKNYWKSLNSKDFGVPQSRQRVFMISILGDYDYAFPKGFKLEKRLKDLLEENVEEKYYLSEKLVKGFKKHLNEQSKEVNGFKFEPIENTDCTAKTITTKAGSRPTDNFIQEKPKLKELTKNKSQGNRVYDPSGLSVSLCANGGGLGAKTGLYIEKTLKQKLCDELVESGILKDETVINHSYTNSGKNPNSMLKLEDFIERADGIMPTLTTRPDVMGYYEDYRIRKLTPRECFRLMGVKDEDFEKIAKNQSNSSLYHLAGDSIVVDVLMAILKNLLP